MCNYRVSHILDTAVTHRTIREDPELDAWRRVSRNFQGVAFEIPTNVWDKLLVLGGIPGATQP